MEAFEHSINSNKTSELAQIIVNLIYTKPIFYFNVITQFMQDNNFSKSIVHAKQSLLLQARLVEEAIKQITTRNRDWNKRFQPSYLILT